MPDATLMLHVAGSKSPRPTSPLPGFRRMQFDAVMRNSSIALLIVLLFGTRDMKPRAAEA